MNKSGVRFAVLLVDQHIVGINLADLTRAITDIQYQRTNFVASKEGLSFVRWLNLTSQDSSIQRMQLRY